MGTGNTRKERKNSRISFGGIQYYGAVPSETGDSETNRNSATKNGGNNENSDRGQCETDGFDTSTENNGRETTVFQNTKENDYNETKGFHNGENRVNGTESFCSARQSAAHTTGLCSSAVDDVNCELTEHEITVRNTELNTPKGHETGSDSRRRNSSIGAPSGLYEPANNITAEDLTELGNSSEVLWPYENTDEQEQEDYTFSSRIRNRDNSLSRFFKRNRDDSILTFFARERAATITTIKENYYKLVRYKHFKKFLSVGVVSFFIWLFFTLAFLPKTSLARDFRRYHHSTPFTKQEVYRSFIQTFSKANDEEFLRLADLFSQSNHLAGDEILTQSTFDYLKQNLGLNMKTESFKMHDSLYNFDMSLELISSDNKVEPVSLIEPCYQNCLRNSLGSYILSEHISKSFDVEAEYAHVGAARSIDFESHDPEALKDRIHLIKRDEDMDLDRQILNSISYGAVGCILYNQHGVPYERESVFYNPNETISRDYLLDEESLDIPVVAISYKSAKHLLENSGKLHMSRNKKVKITGSTEPQLLTNIYTTIPGIWKRNEIIIGVQRDTFSYNGFNSGHLVFLQLCKSFSELRNKGWQPIRTIRLISFDGNSLNNFGARKQYARNKREFDNSIVYIDISRESIQGNKQFHCATTHLFKDAVETAFGMISADKEEGLLEKDGFRFKGDLDFVEMETKSLAYELFYKKNIPTISCKFIDETQSFPHNSNYLTKEFVENVVDTENYALHKLLAQFYGSLVLFLEESEVIPYSTGAFLEKITHEFEDILIKHHDSIVFRRQISNCLDHLTVIFNSFDLYNQRLLKLAYLDYPWYKGVQKLKLLFKIKNTNKKLFAIKNIFITSIRKTMGSLTLLEKDTGGKQELVNHQNLIYQPNSLEGGKIMLFGKLKGLLMLNDKQEIVAYLNKLYKDLKEIEQIALDSYPI